MQYYSTNNKNHQVSFKQAVLDGIAPDGGLYLPKDINPLEASFIDSLSQRSFPEIAYKIARMFVDSINGNDLRTIIDKTFTFDTPLVQLSENLSILELFHGPTLAFKDFGARFLANILSYLTQDDKSEIIILVATSGDTGSAVAHGFYGSGRIKVALLYPSGKVSKIQEQQLTTLDKNIYAFEVKGTFDDCQTLVKTAFLDTDLKKKFTLSSANSINIARLLPQAFYYFNAFAKLNKQEKALVFSVPCGNFGNITGGLLANRLGLPVKEFIAAVNSNQVFYDYLQTGAYEPKTATQTISNAMDVGNPSNFARISVLFGGDRAKLLKKVCSYSITDRETQAAIEELYTIHKYLIDPHGAVGYSAYKKYSSERPSGYHTIVLETAHPAKFQDVIPKSVSKNITVPGRLQDALEKQKKSILISNDFKEFKSELFSQLK
jgi:threonine synthase